MRSSNFLLSTVAALPALLMSNHAAAQTITLDPPPIRLPLDDQAVDLASGAFVPPTVSFSIGGAGSGLSHRMINVNGGWSHNYMLTVKQGTSTTRIVTVGGVSRTFTLVGSTWTSDQQEGETLTQSGTLYILTTKDGTQITFDTTLINGVNNYYGNVLAAGSQIKDPDGKITTLTYRSTTYQKEIKSGFFITMHVLRLQSVNSGTGYQLKFSYFEDSIFDEFDADYWILIASVKGINNAVEYCNPSADSCTLTGDWPSVSYLNTTSGTDKLLTITDKAGNQTRFRRNSSKKITGIKRPSQSADDLVVAYDANQRVQTVTHVGSPANYVRTYTWSGTNPLTAVSTDSLGRTRTTTADTTKHVILTDKNANNQVTTYTPDTYGRITTVDAPEHNKVITAYGARGNVSSVTRQDKTGTINIVTSATYPATCTTPYTALNCNLPLTATDERGNVTNYSWSPTHGQLLSMTSPADAGGVKPETRYTYTGQYAYYHNGASTWVNSSAPIYKATSISSCRVATSGSPASCVGGADEQVTTITYPGSTTANNVQPSSVTKKAGNNTLTSTQSFAYDNNGQLSTIDGPYAGTNDQVKVRYDSVGQVVGRVGPDPDGAGGNPRVAERLTYNVDGQVTISEVGTVADLGDAAWASFSPSLKSVTGYDSFGRATTQAQVATSGTTQYSMAQTTYDAAGRKDCVAVRMNAPLTTTTLPSSACTAMTAGSDGPDRINQWEYNAVDQVTKIHSGVGSAFAQVTAELSYNTASTQNGTLNWAEDAKGNRTGYVYDGFDRNSRINYPSSTTAHTINTGDNEQYTFDNAGNVTQFITRRAETFNLTYDNLNRLTLKDVPARSGLASTHTRDVYYGYDLFGGLSYAHFDSATGEGIGFTYDALGRELTEAQTLDGAPTRTITSGYDVSDNRITMAYPDGNYINYNRDEAGRLYYAALNGSSSLFYPPYDPLGRVAQLYRWGTGVATWDPKTSFAYDAVSRLYSLFQDPSGTTYDANTVLYFNPASQITSRVMNNDAYAWTGHVNVSRSHTANGLNQYSAVGGITYGYDSDGNLISYGTNTYVYDTENRMVSSAWIDNGVNKTATLRYDPLGRLYEVVSTDTGTTRFLYDGDNLISEYNASNTLLRRYVHGPGGGDNPLVWFEGPTVYDTARHYLFSDERGSIVGVTDSNGNLGYINSYDEYGIPADVGALTTKGRFRYTGQAWLPELGMYYYKARMYSPTLGRFMQTDPIGYGDGMNMYRYVGNDPVNGVDPSGLMINVVGSRLACDFSCAQVGRMFAEFNLRGFDRAPDATRGSCDPSSGEIVVCAGRGRARAPVSAAQPQSEACTGPVMSLSIGGSGTFAFMAGGNAGANLTLNIPTNINWAKPWQGLQVVGSAQAGGLLGGGLYAGVGVQRGVGYSSTHATQGFSTSTGAQAEADFGWGTGSVGVSAQGNSGGVSGAVGTKVGAGVGIYAGAGAYGSVQYATPSLGC